MALRVIEDDKLIDDGYEHISARSEQMQNNPTEVERLLRVMWALSGGAYWRPC